MDVLLEELLDLYSQMTTDEKDALVDYAREIINQQMDTD